MKRIKSKQRGVAMIEFVMGFMLFWWMCMAWVEISYMSYISAVSDLAVSEASRSTRLDDSVEEVCTGNNCSSSYSEQFRNALNKSDSLWAQFIDPAKFVFSIQYLKTPTDLEQLNDDYCPIAEGESESECGTAKDSAIAIYRINYKHSPMFNYFINEDQLFSREVIVIQEYERDKFSY
ncbi:pilus assembly protein [Vibrio sinensis]|uniref:Pilus assembly protein n=1 Tax=Vibrio sinensis TaxID=2302434 RepID=A0A3A6Q9D8_9VIBR|nr:TadE family protein [Vibrio sinensis]RJX68439.1 pilus assembly protein [Vibrio sinensis]